MAKAPAAPPATPNVIAENCKKLEKIGGGGELSHLLVAEYRKLAEMRDDGVRGPVIYHWNLGASMVLIREAEVAAAVEKGGPNKQRGSRSFVLLLGESRSAIKNALYLHEAFPTEEAITRLVHRRKPDGRPLAWRVLRILVAPSRSAVRDTLIERAVVEGWTEDDAKEACGIVAPTEAAAPRPVQPPRTLVAGLARWRKDLDTQNSYAAAVFTKPVIKDLISRTDASEVDSETLKDVDEIRKAFEKQVKNAEKALEALALIKSHFAATAKRPRPAAAATPVAAAAVPTHSVPQVASDPQVKPRTAAADLLARARRAKLAAAKS